MNRSLPAGRGGDLQGKDRSDVHGRVCSYNPSAFPPSLAVRCTNAASAGCAGAAYNPFAFPPLHLDVQVPRSTGRARAAIPGGQT